MRVPVWGRAMIGSGFIPIDRRDRQKAIAQLEVAKERLRNGVAVWVAPEGTRGRHGSLGPFKKGGFHVAKQLGTHIVPVYVHNASVLLPARDLRAHYDVAVTVHYGAPIPPSDDLAAQMARVRAAILDLSRGRLVCDA